MRAYLYDNVPGDQREPHESSTPIDTSALEQLGVIYRSIEVDGEGRWEKEIDAFAKERNYKNRDQITVTKAGLGDAYEAKIKSFFDEHLHEDEEIRYILGGSGFFDVRRQDDDQWVRIALEKGDLIVLPAGIYHRFTVDTANTITAMRLFKDEPKWTPLPRSHPETETKEARQSYLTTVKEKAKTLVGAA